VPESRSITCSDGLTEETPGAAISGLLIVLETVMGSAKPKCEIAKLLKVNPLLVSMRDISQTPFAELIGRQSVDNSPSLNPNPN
jgi:hypothetical protein